MERQDAAENQNQPEENQLGSKYLLGQQIGRGAMGVVYAGSTRDGQDLAVKILRPELSSDAKTVSRFIQERHIFSRVDHPNVVRVHDLVAEGDRLGIVMERVSGGDLKARIEAGTITPTQAVRIAAAVADGLQAIHDVDVIHRDLKPANILLATDADGRLMPKISDFGISRLVSEAMTRTSTTIGTPLYMAPESADQRGAGNASDVYALGAMLFEMLTGNPPFHQGGTFAVLRAHALDAPARVEGIPARLTDLIDATLAKEPAARPSVQTTRQLLLDVLPELDDAAKPVAVPVAATPGAAAPATPAGPADTVATGGTGNASGGAALAGAAAGAAAVSGDGAATPSGPSDSSETIVAGTGGAAGNPGDSSETIVTGGAAGGPGDSSETIVSEHQTATTGPAADGSGPGDSSETVVSSTIFGAAAGAAAATPGAPPAPQPPTMPGAQASPLAGAAAGGTLGPAAQTGGGVGGGGNGGGGPIGTSDRAFDRVPRRVIEVGAVLASMAAVALIAFFVLNNGGGENDTGVTAGRTLADDS
ncbi:MAG: serine/threonine-protein kinase, partial [Actinomycetota bacterium]